MTDEVSFSARLTSQGETLTLCIPVRELPRILQARPTRLRIRVIPQDRPSTSADVDSPTYLLALEARLKRASTPAGITESSKP